MKTRFAFIVFVFIVSGLFAQNPNPNSAVDSYILAEMTSERMPGLSTVIVKDGEIVWLESYGLAEILPVRGVSDSTVFLIASISKLLTGTALMVLAENGDLDLDEDINHYLPFNIDIPNHISDSITSRELLTHTSSIKDNDNVLDTYYSAGDPTLSLATIMQRYFSVSGSDYSATNNFHPDAPGTKYDYSNIAVALAGYLVEVISGQAFDQFCERQIFDELCMNSTSWFLAAFDTNNVARPYQFTGGNYVPYAHYGFADYPNGLLRTTITDLANYMIAFLQGGSFNSNSILNNASVAEMLSLQIPSLDNTQGLSWYKEDIYLTAGGTVSCWGHNGGEDGVTTDLYINPANNIGVAVLGNGEGDNLNIVDELYNYALGLSTTGVGNPACSPVGITEQLNHSEISIYPIPSSGEFQIESASFTIREVKIINSLGQVIQQSSTNQKRIDMHLSEQGIYFVLLALENGKTIVHKVMIQ